MRTTVRKLSFRSTKETDHQLDYLRGKTGETDTNLIKRALNKLYNEYSSSSIEDVMSGVGYE